MRALTKTEIMMIGSVVGSSIGSLNACLRQLGLPILLIAHRPETIVTADRVIELAAGRIRSLKT
ncbi:P-loop NTPase family protein [Serratia proteamaculans]|jgi:ABC-type protease/lipase transport system fused ATPase/permease subunit|nr:hypothetical protein [Serratia proteamaculans]NWA71129.1 hypothetical protein [Serratia proteamaculans]CAI0793346.1 Uncharacterised protein [Serratia proteamaculans]CAI0822666.1 Uncharacterised protein [Serratia proteamaculans]CAI0825379.1 Uncharacterised protein [Serratia proteamaculans]CAI1977199.1 Uncharacterised protein [Serratia proteamaculans]